MKQGFWFSSFFFAIFFLNCQTRSIFPTVRLGGVLLTKGKWYYEVVVNNPGVGQIGWVDVEFWAASRGGVGVGDDKHR